MLRVQQLQGQPRLTPLSQASRCGSARSRSTQMDEAGGLAGGGGGETPQRSAQGEGGVVKQLLQFCGCEKGFLQRRVCVATMAWLWHVDTLHLMTWGQVGGHVGC